MNILKYNAFKVMKLHDHDIVPVTSPLYGFVEDYVILLGIIVLPVILGTHPRTAQCMAEFIIVNNQTSHNAIFG